MLSTPLTISCIQVGEGVTKVKTGQRVVPVLPLETSMGNGSWQEYICVSEDRVWPVPDYLSDETAAQFVINPWTSYGMLKDLAVPAGEYVLQSAAGSALGKQVIKLAKHWGVKTINVVRRAEQKAELRALGADEVICSSEEDIVARVKEITGGRGAYAALDAVSGAMTESFVASVRDGGSVYVYGVLGGDGFRFALAHLFRGVHVQGWILYNQILASREKSWKTATEVAELLRDGIFQAAEVEKFDLADFAVAIAKAEEVGKGKKMLLSSY